MTQGFGKDGTDNASSLVGTTADALAKKFDSDATKWNLHELRTAFEGSLF